MGVKSGIATIACVAGIASGVMWYVQPHTPDEIHDQRQQSQVEEYADHQERQDEERRRRLGDDVDRLNDEKRIPSEHRPVDPKLKPKIKIRW